MTSGLVEDRPRRDGTAESRELVLLFAVDGSVSWASPTLVDLLGWDPRAVPGRHLDDFVVAPDPVDPMRDPIRGPAWDPASWVTGETQFTQWALRDRDGVVRHGRVSLVPLRASSGEVETVMAILRGFSASGDVVIDHGLHQLLTENITDVVSITEGDGRIVWVTPSIQSLLGRPPSDVIDHRLSEFVVAEDVAVLSAVLSRILTGETVRFEVRLRFVDDSVRSVSVTSHQVDVPDLDRARVAVWRDVTEATLARESLLESQRDFQRVAENVSDVVIQTDVRGTVEWVSPSVSSELGFRPVDVVDKNVLDFVATTDTARAAAWQTLVLAGERVRTAQIRYHTGRGESRWMSVRAQPLVNGATPEGIIMSLRDAHLEVLARRALNTLSAASRSLTRSATESELLNTMCQSAVNEGGYLLCWYARPGAEDPHHFTRAASSEEHRTYADSAQFSIDGEMGARSPVGAAWRSGQTVVVNDRLNDGRFVELDADARSRGFRASIALPIRCAGVLDGVVVVEAADVGDFDASVVNVLEELAAQIGFGLQRLREHDRLLRSLSDQLLLGAAVEQSGESITITDAHANIVYANPATLHSSGYALEELVGKNPRVFQSGLQNRAFYEAMWRQITSGTTWRGILVNKRKNGELYEEEATISSIHDADGQLTAYIAVKRDLTLERNLQASLTTNDNDRNTILAIMREMRPVSSLEAMANLFCRLVTRLDGIDACTFLILHHNDVLSVMGTYGESFFATTPPPTFPASLIAEMIDEGHPALVVDLANERWNEFAEIREAIRVTEVAGVVVAPLRWNDSTIGVLVLSSREERIAQNFPRRLAAFDQLGSYAGSFFGAQLEAQRHRESLHAKIRDIIDQRAFTPVFQPFVELATGQVVGYEALTRFHHGQRPDQCFMDAHYAGLGPELEAACARASIEAVRDLDTDVWLSLNFSPASLLGHFVEPILALADRMIVLEITEHDQIENYAAIRNVVAGFTNCRLAVDDAGAGFTSLAHILELRPDYVKLDISLIRDIDTNPARQAMTAGMCHFAAQTNTTVIAEGVETAAEAQTLLDLGVSLGQNVQMLGQGFYFGRPETLEA